MATKNITPRDDGEGTLGTAVKNWLKGFFKTIFLGTGGIVDSNSNEVLKPESVADAINEITIKNAASGNAPEAKATGDDTNISFVIRVKGTGAFQVMDGSGNILATFDKVVSAVNYITLLNSITTETLEIKAVGTDTNIDITLVPKGSGKSKTPDGQIIVKTAPALTAGKMVKTNADGVVEDGTNTDAEVADAVTKKHTQHTDTGTTQTTFQIDSGNSGPKIKNNSGVLEAKNAADDAYIEFKALLLTLVEGIDLLGTGKEILAKANSLSFTEQVLTSGAAIAWDLKNGNRARLTAGHNFTITITKPSGAIQAELVVTQDGTGSRIMDEIVTQKDEAIETSEVHADTDIIDISIDIPTGARIRFKTSAADLPDPLVVDTIYYAIRVDSTHIKVATTKANAIAGTQIDITDQGTGTHTVQQLVKWVGGTLGVLQTAAGGEDMVRLAYKPNDEQWYAQILANFY